MIERALTIRQPWASAIFLPSGKDIENRSWPPYAAVGQTIAIHAATNWARHRELAFEKIRRLTGRDLVRADLPRGAIIGVVRVESIVNATTVADGVLPLLAPWLEGPWGLVLRDAMAIEPMPCPGRLSLWRLSPGHAAELSARVKAEQIARAYVGRSP